jgi:hypothetical protein
MVWPFCRGEGVFDVVDALTFAADVAAEVGDVAADAADVVADVAERVEDAAERAAVLFVPLVLLLAQVRVVVVLHLTKHCLGAAGELTELREDERQPHGDQRDEDGAARHDGLEGYLLAHATALRSFSPSARTR